MKTIYSFGVLGCLLMALSWYPNASQAQNSNASYNIDGVYQAPAPGTPGNEAELEDNHFYFDRFGNQFGSLDMRYRYATELNENQAEGQESVVPSNPFVTPDCQSSGGMFNLFFPDIQNSTNSGFDNPANAAALAVICQVFNDLDALIVQATDPCTGGLAQGANIEVLSFSDEASNVLGTASPYYEYYGENSGIKHGEVWKAITGGANDANTLDGNVRINLAYNWYLNLSGTPGGNQVDLYTVMLHEAIHALGFVSLIGETGASKLQLIGGTSVLTNYTPFDQFLRLNGSTPLISNIGGYNWGYTAGNPQVNLTSSCQNPSPMGPDITFNGVFNSSSPVHAPSVWIDGSSLSHYQIGCDGASTDNYIMNPSISLGIVRRITPEEVLTLCDLGYQLSGTYGTPTVAGGGTNPNLQSFATCGTSFVANDDLGPNCSNIVFSTDRCAGTVFTFTTADLIGNDIGANGATIINFEEIATGTPLVQAGTNFTYTPSSVGFNVLRYQLQDGSGNLSNYAYVFINVFPCSDYNCTNTSVCNQICNPGFADAGSDCGCSLGGIPTGCIEGWLRMFGSPDYIVSPPCPATPSGIGNFNYLPNNPDGHLILAGYGPSQATGVLNEAMMTPVSLTAGRRYRLSFFVETYFLNRGNDIGLDLGLLFEDDIYWPLNSNPVPLPTNNQLFGQIGFGETGPNWQQFVFCFTAQDDYDRLFLQAFGDISVMQRLAIDQVELVEDGITSIPTQFNTFCEETIVVGEALCTISNQFFSWWDVTDLNPANHVQLTFGGNLIGQPEGIAVANANGSQLQVTVTQSRRLELRTEFAPLQGIPVVITNCIASFPVEINLLGDLDITKTVTNGSNFANGSTVEYEIVVENNSGFDVNNLKISDVLSADFVANSTSFGTNSNVQTSIAGNELGFEIISLPNGAAETLSFSVNLHPNAGEVVRNCAGYERDGCYYEDCVDIKVFTDTTCEFSLNASFEAMEVQEGTPCTYNFFASADGDTNCTITNYSWNFGDPASGSANTGTGSTIQHTFSGSGTYEVCLIAEQTCDDYVCYDTICKTIVVDCGGDCQITPDAVIDYVKCATNANGDQLYEFRIHVWDPNNLINNAVITSPQGTILSVGPYTNGPPNGQVKRIVGLIDPGTNTGAFCLTVSFPGTPYCTVRVCSKFPKCECAVSNVEVTYPECILPNQQFCVLVEFDYTGPTNIPAIFYLDQVNSDPGFVLNGTFPANPILNIGSNSIVVCFTYTGKCDGTMLFFDAVFLGLESCKLWEMHELTCCDDGQGGGKKERLNAEGINDNWVTLFPNPTSDVIFLNFELDAPSMEVDLALYDLTGRRVLVWEGAELPAGEQQLRWNIGQQLETGNYLLYFKVGNLRYTQSVLLTR